MAATPMDMQLREMRRRLRNAAIAALGALVVGTGGFFILGGGRHGIVDALYMTVITLTTVGYAEIIPLDTHPWGRVFTMVLLVFGFSVLAYFASTLTAFFVEGGLGLVFWRQRMRKAIGELRDHYIVCGDRIVAAHVLDELRRVRRPVVAVVPSAAAMPALATPGDLLAVEGDPADEEILGEAGIARAVGVVAAMESDRENILVTLAARQLNPDVRIVAMLVEPRNETKLRRAGADSVVNPSLIGGLRLASEMIRPSVVSFLDQMLRDRDKNLRIEEIAVGAGSSAAGRRLGELNVSAMPGLLLLAVVEPDGSRTHFKPDDALVVGEGATLIVMGGTDVVGALRQRYGGAGLTAVGAAG